MALKLASFLHNFGLLLSLCLHGKMKQSLQQFRHKNKKILVTTDVTSRGIDIPSVNLVVNYDVANTPKYYIHRVGGTARAGSHGESGTMVTQYDLEAFLAIEEHLQDKTHPFNDEELQLEGLQS